MGRKGSGRLEPVLPGQPINQKPVHSFSGPLCLQTGRRPAQARAQGPPGLRPPPNISPRTLPPLLRLRLAAASVLAAALTPGLTSSAGALPPHAHVCTRASGGGGGAGRGERLQMRHTRLETDQHVLLFRIGHLQLPLEALQPNHQPPQLLARLIRHRCSSSSSIRRRSFPSTSHSGSKGDGAVGGGGGGVAGHEHR